MIATDEGRLWILSRKPKLNFPWLNSHIRYEFKKHLFKSVSQKTFQSNNNNNNANNNFKFGNEDCREY